MKYLQPCPVCGSDPVFRIINSNTLYLGCRECAIERGGTSVKITCTARRFDFTTTLENMWNGLTRPPLLKSYPVDIQKILNDPNL